MSGYSAQVLIKMYFWVWLFYSCWSNMIVPNTDISLWQAVVHQFEFFEGVFDIWPLKIQSHKVNKIGIINGTSKEVHCQEIEGFFWNFPSFPTSTKTNISYCDGQIADQESLWNVLWLQKFILFYCYYNINYSFL